MDVSIIVAAGTTSTRDTLEHPTIGELADAVAQTHAVAGEEFTLKIDGRIADRDEPTRDLGSSSVVELIEVTDNETFESDAVAETDDDDELDPEDDDDE